MLLGSALISLIVVLFPDVLDVVEDAPRSQLLVKKYSSYKIEIFQGRVDLHSRRQKG